MKPDSSKRSSTHEHVNLLLQHTSKLKSLLESDGNKDAVSQQMELLIQIYEKANEYQVKYVYQISTVPQLHCYDLAHVLAWIHKNTTHERHFICVFLKPNAVYVALIYMQSMR